MTAIDDARPPVDLDLLADYFEGLLTGPEAQRVADLVANEPRWAATAARLQAVLPAVHENLLGLAEPMPPDVLDRVLAALPGAAQPADPARAGGSHPTPASRPSSPPAPGRGAPPAGPGRSAPPGRPGHGRRRRGLSAGVGSLVAVVVVLAIGTVVGLGLTHGGAFVGSSSKNSGSGAQAPALGETYRIDIATLPRTASGMNYGPGLAPSFAGGGTPGQATQGPQTTGQPPPAGSSQPQPNDLAPAPLARLEGDAALRDCLTAVATQVQSLPTSVDYAYYVGQPAMIVRLADGRIAAVGSACSADQPDIIYVSGR